MKPLRDWQKHALESWLIAKTGVVSVVTGGGKTILAFACAREVLSLEPDCRLLVVVPTLALQQQWSRQVAHELDLPASAVQIVRSGRRVDPKARVSIAVVNTLRRRDRWPEFRTGKWMLIADECHRYGSPENRKVLVGDWFATLGLSATPEREFDDAFDEYLAPALGQIIYEYSYRDALRDGVLSPFELRNVRVPLNDEERSEYEAMTRAIARLLAQESPEDILRLALLRRARLMQNVESRIPVSLALASEHRGERTMIFHESIEAAEKIASGLMREERRVVTYHSRMSSVARLRSLRMFETGQADTLVTCRALDEGYDVPDVSMGILAASTSSVRQRIQRMGRVLRRSPGKDLATVVSLYATDSEEDRLRAEAVSLAGLVETRWIRAEVS